jgi:threonine/homoserine/homoserine lactone efflux protein
VNRNLFPYVALAGSAFVIGLSGAVMPGPVLAATIPLALSRGFLAGPLIVAGHALVEILLVLVVVSSLGGFLRRENSPALRWISLVGGIMLLLMGGLMLRDVSHLSLKLTSEPTTQVSFPPVPAGMICSLTNPYFILWWATIGLGLLTQSLRSLGGTGLAVFYSGHLLSDLVWYSFVSGAIAFGKDHLNDALYRGLVVLCAAALLFFGIRFIGAGWRKSPAYKA